MAPCGEAAHVNPRLYTATQENAMAFIPTPATAKAVVGMTLHGVSISNSLWFTKSTQWTAAQLETLNEALLNGWMDNVLPVQSSALTLVQVQSYDMQDSDGATMTEMAALNEIGGNAATPALPGNVTVTITFRTDARGRSGRGRIYHAGLTEAQVTGNSLTATVDTALVAAYTTMLAAVELATGADHVIVSFQQDNVPRLVGLPRLVTNVTTDGRIDTQRRRLS